MILETLKGHSFNYVSHFLSENDNLYLFLGGKNLPKTVKNFIMIEFNNNIFAVILTKIQRTVDQNEMSESYYKVTESLF